MDASPVTLGDLIEGMGPLALLISPLALALIVAGLVLVFLARPPVLIKAYLALALLPLLLGLVASKTSVEARREVAARHEELGEEDLAALPVTMGVVTSVPCLALGFVALLRASGRRRRGPRPRAGGDPLGSSSNRN